MLQSRSLSALDARATTTSLLDASSNGLRDGAAEKFGYLEARLREEPHELGRRVDVVHDCLVSRTSSGR